MLFLCTIAITSCFSFLFFYSEESPSQSSVKPDLLEFGSNITKVYESAEIAEEKGDGVVTQKIEFLKASITVVKKASTVPLAT